LEGHDERATVTSGHGDPAVPVLRRELTLRDVVLFFITAGTNLQWVATAAAAGPSSLVVWVIGGLAMFVPLAVCVVDLSSHYPEEGGLYVWSQRAFGPFAGFLTGWSYWCSNLPYFPGLLYFTAGNALFMAGDAGRVLSASPTYFIAASLGGLALATWLNVVGLGVGKWLNNVGAVSRWLTTMVLIGIGLLAWITLGSATELTAESLRPGLRLRDLLFWSAIAFAWTGPEAASFMGGEVVDARRTIPRALALAAPMIAAIYLLGTLAVLVALPPGEATGLQGVLQAISKAEERLGLVGVAPVAAFLMTVTCLGSVGAWLGAVARIPFVAGIDHYLPERFGRPHPRWGSPYIALLTQAGVTVIFVVLGQAGTTVKGAYDVLISMTFLVTFIPFLFVFASAIKLHIEPPPAGTLRIPGGRATIVLVAAIGLCTTLGSMALAVIPAPEEPRKVLAVTKIVGLTLALLATGVGVYAAGHRRAAARARREG
jgi:amino acid transporter